MKKLLFVALSCAACSVSAFAQTAPQQQDSFKVKRETIVFTSETPKADAKKSAQPERVNFLKINPLLILNGDVPIYYERGLFPNVSLEVGLGMTMQDVMVDFMEEEDDTPADEKITKSHGFGISYRISPRFYPSFKYEGYTGWYFAPMFRQQIYNATVTQINKEKFNVAQQQTVTDIKMLIGYQADLDYDRVILDVYTGIGPKMTNYKNDVVFEEGISGKTATFEDRVEKKLSLALGFKVGFAF
ncbi:MAG: hypothetical protein LPJ89_02960 [Hymenobacteraceae bacterium]|nr:hypothetical protein [Hymenobacteraceae bacterium]